MRRCPGWRSWSRSRTAFTTIAVRNARRGEPDIVWRSDLTLAEAESLVRRMRDGGDIKWFQVGYFSGPFFDFDEDDSAELRREVTEGVNANLRVPAWWTDEEDEGHAIAIGRAIADASGGPIGFAPYSMVDAATCIGQSALDEGYGVWTLTFYSPATEDADSDPLFRLTMHIEEPDRAEGEEDGEPC